MSELCRSPLYAPGAWAYAQPVDQGEMGKIRDVILGDPPEPMTGLASVAAPPPTPVPPLPTDYNG